MAPPLPPVMLFRLLVWDADYVVGTTCNDRRSLRNTFQWMGRYKPPSNLWSEGANNLNLTVLKSGSNIAPQYVDGYAFFHVHCSTKSQENPKGLKFSILKFLIRKKMCVFYSSSWMIFLKFKRQAIYRVTDQCQDRPSTLQHLSDFSKMFYFLQFHGHSII